MTGGQRGGGQSSLREASYQPPPPTALASQRIDIDQNGTIEEEELMAAISGSAGLTRADVKFLVDSVDINRDGKIDLMEFHAMMRNATL